MADDATFDSSPDVLNATAQGRLRTIIERLERLEEDKQAVMADMKTAAETVLRTRFGGVAEVKPWGPQIQCWWAFEMVMASEKALLQADENLVRYNLTYGRVMNNAVLKTFERMGRDLLAMTKIFDERKDPRQADREMQSGRPSNYWSKDHFWGPNWPIAPPAEDTADPVGDAQA